MENKRDLLEQKGHIMKKTISGIMCGIIATGLLAGCVNVSESNPSEKKIHTAAKPDQTVLQERLYKAIKGNDLKTVKKLVAQGADITFADDFTGQNALHHAACFHSMDVFQWLLDQGMEIHTIDKFGNTVLHLLFDLSGAGYYGKNMDTGEFYCSHKTKSKPETILKMVKYLTDRKVNINAKNQHGMTPVRLAVCFGYLEIVKYLVEHGTNIKGTLHLAAKTAQYEMVKYLVEHGADVNEFDGEALADASGTAIVRYLVEHGAKINIQDEWGRSPLHWHAERKNLETIKYLVEHGVDLNLRDKEGRTPLDLAEMHKHQEIAKYLKDHGAVSGKSLNCKEK